MPVSSEHSTSSDDPRGRIVARFQTDPREQLAYARLRAGSAVLGVLAAAAMLLGELPLPAFMVALLGLAIAAVWLRQARRAARAARSGRREALTVHERGFALEEGERTHWVPWSNVESIDVDEERLDITIQRRDSARMRLEPRYPGVDIYAIVRTLNDAREASRSATARQGGTPSP